MSGFLHRWILDLTAAALISACAMAITPEGRVKKAVRAVCGIVAVIALLSPLSQISGFDLEQTLAGYESEALAASDALSELNENITRDIIESETAAYISDKGKTLGAGIESVTVTAKMREDGFYYPYGAEITAETDVGKRELYKYIREELGIDEDRIVWRNTNDD